MEIERKWLMEENKLPDDIKTYAGHRIIQGYLNPGEDYLIRVRYNRSTQYPDNKVYKLEIKSSGLFFRDEWRYETTEENFKEIYEKCRRKISKTRYYMSVDHLQYEIDFYDAYDFITLEIEFDSIEEAENFQAPDWFGEEITYDTQFKNVNLAR